MCNEDPVTAMVRVMKTDRVREAEKMLTWSIAQYRKYRSTVNAPYLALAFIVDERLLGYARLVAEAHLALEDAVDNATKEIAQEILAGRDKAARERKTNPTQPPNGYSLNGLRNTLPREEKT